MQRVNVLIKLLLVSGIIFSLNSCINHEDAKLIEKQNEEISVLKIELGNLKNEKEQLEFNKKLVIDFYQEVFGDLKSEAVHKYMSNNYIGHNPTLSDGKQALIDATKIWFKGATPYKIDVQKVLAEGDLVFIHLKDDNGVNIVSVMDVFRIENNRIVEHWDVHQKVPEKSINEHPMF